MSKRLWIGFVLILSALNSEVASAGLSGRMMQVASTHSGHRELESHIFIQNLKEGKFRREQIAQFYSDRIYLLNIMEKALQIDCVVPDDLPTDVKAQMSDEIQVFCRSKGYQEDLYRLIGTWIEVQPSEAAKRYGEYLLKANQETVVTHMWLFLMGETFGAQHISNYIQAKFPSVGHASKSFGNLNLSKVRRGLNIWLEDQLGDPVLDVKEEIGHAYEFLLGTFDAAESTENVSLGQSVLTVISNGYFLGVGRFFQ